jgi:hypothetical protein
LPSMRCESCDECRLPPVFLLDSPLITSLLVFYSDLGPPYHVIPRGSNVVSISVTERGKNARR